MSINSPTYVSASRLKALTEELHQLRTVTMREVAAHIDEAKQQGDLSENAEYHEAKERMAFVHGRIAEIENIIAHATVIDEGAQTPGGVVRVGSTIVVEAQGGTRTFVIVGSNEADPTAGKISNESPLGEAFLGHAVGEMVDVITPIKKTTYRIVSIR